MVEVDRTVTRNLYAAGLLQNGRENLGQKGAKDAKGTK